MNKRRHSLARYIDSVDPVTHFTIARGPTQPGFGSLECLLARAWADGRFEMINPGWHRLGYSDTELTGRGLCELIALEPYAAREAIRSLLTEGRSVEFALQCRDGSERSFRWNRQFDDFTTSMFIVAEEMSAIPPASRAMSVPRATEARPT